MTTSISSALVPYIPSCTLPVVSSSSSSYEEITRRVSNDELVDIENKMRCLSPLDQKEFLHLVQVGNLSAILQMQDAPLHALYAVKQGSITQEDFATIALVSGSSDPNKICIPLFEANGQVNPQARDLIQQTLSLQDAAQSYDKLLNQPELDAFFEEMAKLPPLQRQFFLESRQEPEFKDTRDFYLEYNPNIRDVIQAQYTGLNVFSRCLYKDAAKLMIPSSGMMQTFLNIKFKENAVKMNFVLGLSSLDDITQNGLSRSRDAALPFPGVFLPSTADKQEALETDFLYHDFFHAFLLSCAPHESRVRMISLAKAIQPLVNAAFYNHMIDLELSYHYKLNLLIKAQEPDLFKFLSELDFQLAVGSLFDPNLKKTALANRVVYSLVSALGENLTSLRKYQKWELSLGKQLIEKLEDKIEKISKARDELSQEILDLNKKTRKKTKKLISDRIVTKFVEAELEDQQDELYKTLFQLSSASRGRSFTDDMIKALKKRCFFEPPFDPKICKSNITMSEIEEPIARNFSVAPLAVLTGIITLIMLRLLLRKNVPSKAAS